MPRFRLNIRAKVLLLTLLVAWPPLLLVSFLGLTSLNSARDMAVQSATAALRAQVETTLAKRAIDKSRLYNETLAGVQQQIEETAHYAEVLLNRPPQPGVGRVWISPDGPTEAAAQSHAAAVARAQQIQPLLNATTRSNRLISLAYIGLEDGGVASFDHDIVDVLLQIKPFDVRTRPWYIAARQAGRTVWVDTYIDANTKEPVVTCATPLYDSSGAFVGAIGFDMLLGTIQQDVLQLDMGGQSYAFLMNRAGSVLVRPNMQIGKATWDQPLTGNNLLETANPQQRAVFERMTRQDQGTEQIFYEGGKVYLAFAPIPIAGWSVGIVVPEAEIIGPASDVGAVIVASQQRLRTQILVAIVLSLVVALGMSALISFVFGRSLRRLAAGAQQVAAGDLSHTIAETSNDEIGDLVRSFNTMTVALRQKVDELEENLRQFATLNEVSNHFKAIFSLSQLLDDIPRAVCQDFGFDRAALYLLDGQTLRAVSASFGPGSTELVAEFLAVANSDPLTLDSPTVEADVVRSGQAVIVDDPWSHPRVPQAKQQIARSESYVLVPIFGPQDRVIGLLSADYYHVRRRISARDAAQLLTFASMVGLTIENTRLYNDLERQVAQRTAELRVALERAQEADRLKGQFLAAISHELRTPLNAIIGFSTVLIDELDGPLTALQREDLQTINQNGRFLLHLINELLDLARIESGKLEMQIAPLDIAEIVHDVADTMQGLLYGKPVTLRVMLRPDLPLVSADRAKTRQILLNLLSNAVKFTERGEIVITAHTVALSTPPLGHDEATPGEARQLSRQLAITVRDTGIGIAAENLPLIFEEFRQVHAGRTGNRGSGLGLAITRRLVEIHRGRIWVESTLGEGSAFTYTLPLAIEADQQRAHGARQPAETTMT